MQISNLKSNLRNSLVALPALMFLVSCGSQKPMVDDIEVKPSYQGSDLYISLSADLALGNVALPQVSLPINHKGEVIGSVSMNTLIGGQNQLQVDLNVSAVTNIPQGQVGQLPNGGALPLIGSNDTIIVPIANKAELYITISDGQAALGVSIPFKTLDSVGAKVGNASLFPMFNINQVIGSAGLYFSPNAGENGFGLFADITQVLQGDMFQTLGFRPDIQAESSLEYGSIQPSSRTEKKINKQLYYLNRRKAVMQLH